MIVVYFDQRTHACVCVCMVENDKKHSKMSKKVIFRDDGHTTAGCSFGILLFLHFFTCTTHLTDLNISEKYSIIFLFIMKQLGIVPHSGTPPNTTHKDRDSRVC